jgi:uronate dehydrogenase
MPSTPQQPDPHRVLVTGAAGTIGAIVTRALQQRGHRVRGLDRAPAPDLADHLVGDIADRPTVERALADIDTLVHLAAHPNPADFIDTLLGPNVIGLYHVVTAAVAAGVRRIVLASSMQVVFGRRQHKSAEDDAALISTQVRAPTNDYALTKIWAEDLGEMIARVEGVEVIAARIGHLPRTPHEAGRMAARPRGHEFFLSHDDAGRFFVRAVEAPWPSDAGPVRFHVAYVMGPPPDGQPRHDRKPGEALGYHPQDVFPHGLPFALPEGSG